MKARTFYKQKVVPWGQNKLPIFYANIFICGFEEEHLPLIKYLCTLNLQYIYNLFFIWTGTKEQFIKTVHILNTSHTSIKFDYEISDEEVNFSDTTVSIAVKTKSTSRLESIHVAPFWRKAPKTQFFHT